MKASAAGKRGSAATKKPGWQVTKLGEVVELVMGQAPSSKDTNFEGLGIPFVKVGEFGSIRPVIREWTTNPLRMAKREDVLLCVVGATCGKINLGENCAIGRSVAAIRPIPTKLDQFFLYFFMQTLVERLRSGSMGAAQTVISKEMIVSVDIPIPPLSEQQRIVAILDEAFAELATAKANAQQNLANVRALFESHLNAVFSQRGEGWVETTIGDQLTLQRGFDITKAEQIHGDVPVVSSGGIKSYHNSAMVAGPGVVIGRKGTLGKVFFLECEYWPHDTTLWVKDFKGNFPRFVFYFFLGLDVKSLDSGAANPALNRNQVHPMHVNWPAIYLQRNIAVRLDALAAATRRLAGIYARKVAALEEMKQALLARAFAGEL